MTEYKCYTPDCGFETNDRTEYETHGITEHRGQPCYPGTADLEYYDWKPQGREWEVPVNKKKDFDRFLKDWNGIVN
jgi:hypothetical protein